MQFFCFWLPWQPELSMELNSLNNFCSASPKEHPCQLSSRLAQWFRRCLKKLLMDAGHRKLGDHHSSLSVLCAHVKVLRWAKNITSTCMQSHMFSQVMFLCITVSTKFAGKSLVAQVCLLVSLQARLGAKLFVTNITGGSIGDCLLKHKFNTSGF